MYKVYQYDYKNALGSYPDKWNRILIVKGKQFYKTITNSSSVEIFEHPSDSDLTRLSTYTNWVFVKEYKDEIELLIDYPILMM